MKKRACVVGKQNEQISTSIKMKLNSILRDRLVYAHIDKIVNNISRIQYLASHFINFHLLRLLTEKISLPVLNQTFFSRCCIIVTDTKKRNLDLELISSFAQFSLLYPFAHPVNQHMGHFISSLARQMMVNFDNQLALEFPKRIIRYVRFKFGLAKYQAEGFVKSCFTNNLVLNKEQTEFRNWVKFYPLDPIQIPFNDHHFLKLSLKYWSI